MDLYAPFVRHVVAPLHALYEGNPIYSILRELEQTQWLSPEELRRRQWEKLERMVRHAGDRCPFYRERFAAAGLDPARFTLEDFQRLPALTKADIRKETPRLQAEGMQDVRIRQGRTGGSTSVPLEFVVDERSAQRKGACALRHNAWAGWHPGDKVAMVWGATDVDSTFKLRMRNLILDRRFALDTLRLDEAMMHDFARRMRSEQPRVVYGHSHSTYILACFMKKHGYAAPTVKTVVSTSTVLADVERAEIEDFFQCKVFDRYGCEEVSLISSECDRHEGMHINLDHLFVEFLQNGRPVGPGECGEIHLTDLTNVAMPFLRYKVEDAGTPTAHVCSCGRGMPMMEKVQGRVADFIVTPDGRVIFGVSILDNFTAKFMGLERVQIIQDVIDHLIVKIVRGEGFDEKVVRGFQDRIPEFFGKEMRYDLEFVDEIPREISGKYRFTISKIPNPFQEAAGRAIGRTPPA